MKTKTNLLWCMLLTAVFTCGLTSCGSDSSDDALDDLSKRNSAELVGNLQGTWDFYSGSMMMMGQRMNIDRNTLLQYKPSDVSLWDLTFVFSGNTVNGVTYRIENDQLLVDNMSIYDNFTIKIKSITSSVLVLAETYTDEGMSMTIDLEYHKRQ